MCDRAQADKLSVNSRWVIVTVVCVLALSALGWLPASAGASGARSSGTAEQIAWVRRAATRFVSAELAGDGASACEVLAAHLRASEHGRTCAQRWDAQLRRLLREPGGRARMRAQKAAIPAAAVTVRGAVASIALPTPLMGSSSRFVWSENCWMLND